MRLPHLFCAAVIAVILVTGARAAPVDVPAGIDHAPYDRLLKKYVNDRGLVNYRGWKENQDDAQALSDYTLRFAKDGPFAEGNEKVASLINIYNARTILWILVNYPTKSIKSTENPWGAKRHKVGGRVVSLDEIEHDTLRPLVGYRIHAVLVCAAKSCPPLRAAAYTPDNLDEQLDAAMRRWLARDDLNSFDPATGRAQLSKIFSWYAKDFPDLPAILNKYAPVSGNWKISDKPYNWSLNEQ